MRNSNFTPSITRSQERDSGGEKARADTHFEKIIPITEWTLDTEAPGSQSENRKINPVVTAYSGETSGVAWRSKVKLEKSRWN